MKNTKKIVSIALSTLILSSSMVGLAADGDIYNADGSLYGNKTDVVRSKAKRRDIIRKQDQFLYELNDLQFFYKDIATAYAVNPENWENEVLSNPDIYVPVNQETELKVESVSAINKTTVKVTFDKAVDKADATSFTIEGGRVISSTLSKDKKSVTLDVTGLSYGKDYSLVIQNIVIDGKTPEMITTSFTTPGVEDIWDLEVVPAKSTIVADGRDNMTVSFKLVDKLTREVDVNANDMILELSTTYGSLGQKRVTVQNGVAEVILRSEFNAKGVSAKIDAQIIEASGDYTDLIGKVEGTKNIAFTAPGATGVEARYVTAANTNEADRVTLTFDKEVSLSDFIQTNAKGDLINKLQSELGGNGNTITVKQGIKELKVKGFLAGPTNKTIIAVLDIDRNATSNEVVATNILTDNTEVQVAAKILNTSDKKFTLSDQTFNFTDSRNPNATSVNVEGLNKLKVKFSEPIAKSSFLIDARHGEDKFDVEYGTFEFDPVAKEFVDNRNFVDITLKSTYDDDEGNNKGYFKAGNHVLQVSNIYDFAAITDANNIGVTQKLNFNIEEDNDIANASVIVDSPNQYRVAFDKDAKITNPATDITLEVYDTTSKEWVEADLNVNDLKTKPTIKVKQIKGDTAIKQYKVEVTNSWSDDVYDTANTRNNYYNDRFRLVIKEDQLTTTANGKKNLADVILPLNAPGSPMNSSDTKSPEILKMEETLVDGRYEVTMSEPIQNNDTPVVGSVQFEGTDKDGKIRTFIGKSESFTDEGLDNRFYVNMDGNYNDIADIVAKGGSNDWKLVIRDVTDDIGNKAATVTKNFKVLVDEAENEFTVTSVKAENGKIIVKYSQDVAIFGNGEATDYKNYTLNGSVLPVGTDIKLGVTDDIVEITVADGVLLDSNILDVGKNIVSKDGLSLTGKTSFAFKSEAAAAASEVAAGNITSDAGLALLLSQYSNSTPFAGDLTINGLSITGDTSVTPNKIDLSTLNVSGTLTIIDDATKDIDSTQVTAGSIVIQ